MSEITYLEAIREALFEEMARDENVFCLGEDIGAYGGAVKVTDQAVAVPADIDGTFRRVLTLTSDAPPADLWFRAWSGKSVEEQGGGVFLADGRVRLRIETSGAARPRVRQSGAKMELLVPMTFRDREARLVEDIVW